MLRHERKLHKKIVPTSLPESKGKFQEQHLYYQNRNIKLAHRYYYYSVICRMLYVDCLVQLEREFDITANTIEQHLKRRETLIQQLAEAKVTAQSLRQKYPWLDWSKQALIPLR